MNDSRIAQARALVDDARCLLADIEEELGAVTPIELRGARGDLNVALRRLNRLENSLGRDRPATTRAILTALRQTTDSQILAWGTPTENKMRLAAFQAGVFQTIEQRAKELKDSAKIELAKGLEAGDTVAGKFDGEAIAKATMTKGRTKLVVTNERELLAWMEDRHPTEVLEAVNPAYLKLLEARAKELGAPVDFDGELVPGVELTEGEPYVSIRKEKNALELVGELLRGGRISLDGIREIEQ